MPNCIYFTKSKCCIVLKAIRDVGTSPFLSLLVLHNTNYKPQWCYAVVERYLYVMLSGTNVTRVHEMLLSYLYPRGVCAFYVHFFLLWLIKCNASSLKHM